MITAEVTQSEKPTLDKLAKWMEETGASLETCVIGGEYVARVKWGKMQRYSDRLGGLRSTWEISRSHRDLFIAQSEALGAAFDIYNGKEPKT